MTDDWLTHFREHARKAPFTPYHFDGEDANLRAFTSREAFMEWFGQPPGPIGNPYRDDAFYVRELTEISRRIAPRTIVEFGTSLGLGTYLLSLLNPDALLITVDNRATQYLPGDIEVPTGFLARHQQIPVQYVRESSANFRFSGVDLCFIDADHSYDAVKWDSERAWANRSTDHPWAIIWHDHNARHPGVRLAVAEFCDEHRLQLHSRPDSATVWVHETIQHPIFEESDADRPSIQ